MEYNSAGFSIKYRILKKICIPWNFSEFSGGSASLPGNYILMKDDPWEKRQIWHRMLYAFF